MPTTRLKLKATREQAGQRLDQVLASWLPIALGREDISKAKVRKLIIAGAVYLNGARIRIASREIRAGAEIQVYVDLAKLQGDSASKDLAFELRPENILYEDQWLIAVDKPARLPTQPTIDEARKNLYAIVKKYLSRRENKPDAYLGLHHRLDRDTSGVILFTKTKDVNPKVAELFSERIAKKTYQALCIRATGETPPENWEVKNYLASKKGPGKATRMRSVTSGGDFAHTVFRLVETMPGGLWIEAHPKTGRMHQIRVHLAEGGHPILGDHQYGNAEVAARAERVMLHASELTFTHPVTQDKILIQSPLPEDFKKCLLRLRKTGSDS